MEYLRSLEEFKGVFISGDMVGRSPGTSAVIVEHDGGHRDVRDRMDRAGFSINTYAASKPRCSKLAYAVREYLLEHMPSMVLDTVQVLDVAETNSPRSFPDPESREARFLGTVEIYFVEVSPRKTV
ncbi:hypothetical protein [Streptomyces sp. CBMA123]|uniref:hypothetical protein n=1 Tax=Streptomyces sp. CBMA123 TaxID=1896313 RepID=UPI001661DDBE|nr:hypothetical protein [Streptomyces sp. CBMA123]